MRLSKTIAWALIGSTLSIGLAGCATKAPAEPAVLALKVGPPAPPADLIVCPVAPAGFPTDEVATLPPAVRAAAIRLAKAYAATAAQLSSLIDFTVPGTCQP